MIAEEVAVWAYAVFQAERPAERVAGLRGVADEPVTRRGGRRSRGGCRDGRARASTGEGRYAATSRTSTGSEEVARRHDDVMPAIAALGPVIPAAAGDSCTSTTSGCEALSRTMAQRLRCSTSTGSTGRQEWRVKAYADPTALHRRPPKARASTVGYRLPAAPASGAGKRRKRPPCRRPRRLRASTRRPSRCAAGCHPQDRAAHRSTSGTNAWTSQRDLPGGGLERSSEFVARRRDARPSNGPDRSRSPAHGRRTPSRGWSSREPRRWSTQPARSPADTHGRRQSRSSTCSTGCSAAGWSSPATS